MLLVTGTWSIICKAKLHVNLSFQLHITVIITLVVLVTKLGFHCGMYW